MGDIGSLAVGGAGLGALAGIRARPPVEGQLYLLGTVRAVAHHDLQLVADPGQLRGHECHGDPLAQRRRGGAAGDRRWRVCGGAGIDDRRGSHGAAAGASDGGAGGGSGG